MRNLKLYKWKQGFHKLLWEGIKKDLNGELPDWTYEELEAKGFSIYLSPTGSGSSTRLGIINNNSKESVTFAFYLENLRLPAISPLFYTLHGIKILGNNDEELDTVYNNLVEWYDFAILPNEYAPTSAGIVKHYETYGDKNGVSNRTNTTHKHRMVSMYVTPRSRPYLYDIVNTNELDKSIKYPEVSTMEAFYKKCVYSASGSNIWWSLNNGKA